MATHSRSTTVTAGLGQPQRWTDSEKRVWVVYLFFGAVFLYAARGALPVTVVEMSAEFNWDKKMNGIVLSAFFWGYMVTQIIGGQLSDRHGGELVLWVFGIGWSLTILSITLTANLSEMFVIVGNFVNGLCQGVHFPATISITSCRINNEKRSFLYGLIASGANLGTMLCGVLGYLFVFNGGWEYMLLIIGLLGLIWAVLLKWLSEAHDKKVFYRLLDDENKNINESAISADLRKREATCLDIPWKLLLKQGPILAMFCSNFGQAMFFHTMMAWSPTYFHETFPEMKDKAWLYNVTPWISKGIANIISGWIAKRMIEEGTSITYTRKCMEGVSNMGVTLPLIGLAIFGTNPHHFYLSLILFNASFFLHGFEVAGSTINPTDLVPSFSGILYGMMNTGGSIAGILGVSFASHILHTTDNWGLVFIVLAGVTFTGCIVYLCFGSGKRLTHIDA